MQAIAVFPTSREVKLIDVTRPEISQPSEVKVRVLDVGICGTDREISAFHYGEPPEGAEYLILGHEALGEVVELGSAVRDFAVGDLVVPTVRRPCPHPECEACRANRSDFCTTGDFSERGIKGLHGFMAEYVVEDARYLHRVPKALRRFGVLTEPLSIAEKSFVQTRQIQQRMPWLDYSRPEEHHGADYTAAVLGAGPVGLLAAMALCAMGFDTFVYDRLPAPNPKSDLVESIGASYIFGADTDTRFTDLISHVHLIYEATGVSHVAFQAIGALGHNSILVFTGVPGPGPLTSLDTDTLMRNMVLNNQVILGTVNANEEAYDAAIGHLRMFAERWPQALDVLVSGRYLPSSYADLLFGHTGGIKNVITFDRR
jgi:threonine dehydrogenase-like Zn-dependent dehydrogenase